MKATLTSLNTAFCQYFGHVSSDANLYGYFVNHCLAVFCKFLGDFLGILGKRGFFFSKDRLN